MVKAGYMRRAFDPLQRGSDTKAASYKYAPSVYKIIAANTKTKISEIFPFLWKYNKQNRLKIYDGKKTDQQTVVMQILILYLATFSNKDI